MGKKIQLSIPQPCHEDWNKMSAADKGRFCAACQKQVVDFSIMTDREIAEFFRKPTLSFSKDGSVCGRFMHDQLNRDLEIPRKRIPWVKYFFQFAIPAFLFSMRAKAQGSVIVIKKDQLLQTEQKQLTGTFKKKEKAEKMVSLNGKVIDENNNPVPFATIMLSGTHIGVKADEEGAFHFTHKTNLEEMEFIASSAGFKKKHITTTINDYPKNELIIVLESNSTLKEVVVTSGGPIIKGKLVGYSIVSRTSFVDTVKSFFQKTERPRTYPNPVKGGTTLHIEWNKTEAGNYFMQLIGQGGQLVHSRQLWIDAEARILDMQVPNVAAGNYFLRMTHSTSGKSFTEKVIIQ